MTDEDEDPYMTDEDEDEDPYYCGNYCDDETIPCIPVRNQFCDGEPDSWSLYDIPYLHGYCLNERCYDIDTINKMLAKGDGKGGPPLEPEAQYPFYSDRQHALMSYAERGNTDIVKYLIELGVDAGPALIYAAARGKTDIVHLLLAYGADKRTVHSRAEPALRAAKARGDTEAVKLLTLIQPPSQQREKPCQCWWCLDNIRRSKG